MSNRGIANHQRFKTKFWKDKNIPEKEQQHFLVVGNIIGSQYQPLQISKLQKTRQQIVTQRIVKRQQQMQKSIKKIQNSFYLNLSKRTSSRTKSFAETARSHIDKSNRSNNKTKLKFCIFTQPKSEAKTEQTKRPLSSVSYSFDYTKKKRNLNPELEEPNNPLQTYYNHFFIPAKPRIQSAMGIYRH